MKAKAVLKLKLPSGKISEIVYEALMPEIKRPATTRSKAKLETEGNMLVLDIESRDTVGLRAAVNAYLRWIFSCVALLQTIERLGISYNAHAKEKAGAKNNAYLKTIKHV